MDNESHKQHRIMHTKPNRIALHPKVKPDLYSAAIHQNESAAIRKVLILQISQPFHPKLRYNFNAVQFFSNK